jgi:polysaccharide biosynthesis protein PslH
VAKIAFVGGKPIGAVDRQRIGLMPAKAQITTAARAPRGILMLVHRIPYPPDRGDKIRSFHILKALSKIAPVHLACFADDARDMGFAEALKPYTASRCIVERLPNKPLAALQSCIKHTPLSVELFDNKRIKAYVRNKIVSGLIDHVFAFSGQMAHFVPPGFSGQFTMDFVDVDSAKFAAYAADANALSPMRLVHAREGRLLAIYEARIARRAAANLFVSEAEAALFRSRSGLNADAVQALENGVDLEFFNPKYTPSVPEKSIPKPLIVFTGQMDYRPNIDAVVHFVHAVLPQIRLTHPTAHFAIVGRGPTPEVCALAKSNGVTVTGAVDDVRSWLAAADVVVAPLLLARGIQNKVLEAMAMGKPVVVSPAAAEGIDARDGRDMVVADDALHMAVAVSALLDNPVRAAKIGAAARKQVEKRYSWDAQLSKLPAIMGVTL